MLPSCLREGVRRLLAAPLPDEGSKQGRTELGRITYGTKTRTCFTGVLCGCVEVVGKCFGPRGRAKPALQCFEKLLGPTTMGWRRKEDSYLCQKLEGGGAGQQWLKRAPNRWKGVVSSPT